MKHHEVADQHLCIPTIRIASASETAKPWIAWKSHCPPTLAGSASSKLRRSAHHSSGSRAANFSSLLPVTKSHLTVQLVPVFSDKKGNDAGVLELYTQPDVHLLMHCRTATDLLVRLTCAALTWLADTGY